MNKTTFFFKFQNKITYEESRITFQALDVKTKHFMSF